jgi:hypothetical protein
MQIILNSEPQIPGHLRLRSYLETVANDTLGHDVDRIVRIDAHLSDANSAAKADTDDIHCTLEAQVTGLAPVIVKDRAGSAGQAIHGAVGKMERAIEHAIGKHEPHWKKASRDDPSPV